MGRSVEFKADVCLCGFWFFVVVNVGVVKLTFVILLKIRVGSVFLSSQNNQIIYFCCFVLFWEKSLIRKHRIWETCFIF